MTFTFPTLYNFLLQGSVQEKGQGIKADSPVVSGLPGDLDITLLRHLNDALDSTAGLVIDIIIVLVVGIVAGLVTVIVVFLLVDFTGDRKSTLSSKKKAVAATE